MPGRPAPPVDVGPAALETVADLHRRALSALEGYRPEEAAQLLDAAQAALAATPARVRHSDRAAELGTRIMLAASWAAYERHGPDEAEKVAGHAAELARSTGRGDLVALCHLQTASVRGRAGDLTGSLRAMHLAEEGMAELPLTDQARLLTNRGVLGAQLMRLPEAEADLHFVEHEERLVVNGSPLSTTRVALTRRPGLDLPLIERSFSGPDSDDDDGPSPLDVPAFLRRKDA